MTKEVSYLSKLELISLDWLPYVLATNGEKPDSEISKQSPFSIDFYKRVLYDYFDRGSDWIWVQDFVDLGIKLRCWKEEKAIIGLKEAK